jgi:hypothetical protein
MTFSPTRHDLPNALVSADAPLSADVMSRSVESINYLWQVTTNTIDSAGTVCPSPQGHTHDGKNDQTLSATSEFITGWSFGFGAPYVECSSDGTFVNHYTPRGGWVVSATPTTVIRSMIHVPFDVTLGSPNSAAFMVHVLIEKGVLLSAANAVTITATIGGVTLTGTSAAAAAGLEVVSVGPFAAAAMNGGPQEMLIASQSAVTADYSRVWHASMVTA